MSEATKGNPALAYEVAGSEDYHQTNIKRIHDASKAVMDEALTMHGGPLSFSPEEAYTQDPTNEMPEGYDLDKSEDYLLGVKFKKVYNNMLEDMQELADLDAQSKAIEAIAKNASYMIEDEQYQADQLRHGYAAAEARLSRTYDNARE